ncbi:MAG: permease-like cell division protein FtsX [Bacteroidota bacterium]|nr:permease-like cell division protein FtsX [Bacteroidota bacterium]MDP3144529.1 permease-like cell division protein FtsX [Bacteroidota bacterium]MDP3558229.1 permease-like cell division protein FtsX [Bacteroidota bacterium]
MSDNLTKKRLRTSGITVIISLALVLFMLGALGLLVINANKLSKHFKENVGFQIYLKDTASSAQTDGLLQEISNSNYAKSVNLINKEQAAEKLKVDLGEDFVSFLGSNPLLNSLEVKLNANYANTDTLQIIEKALLQKGYIKEVVYQKDMINSLNKNTRAIAFFILIFSSALLIVAIALINNTIRLSIYSQRFLIRTMYLVGATRSFISKPFIFKGVRQGIIAGIVASVLLVGLLAISTRFIPDLLQLQDENLLLILFSSIILVGVIISAFSAMLAVLRFLRLKTSDLYF